LEVQNPEPIAESTGESNGVEYSALTQGAGVRIMTERIVVRVVGDDRVSFLHGMCSNDIKKAHPGVIVPALFLTEHAHVIAEFFAWIAEDSVLIEIDRVAWTPARAHLEKLLVADDVEFEETEFAVLDVEGPRAADAAQAVIGSGTMPPIWEWTEVADVRAGNVPRAGSAAISMLLDSKMAAAAIDTIDALGPDFRRIEFAAIDTLRIENGIARVGVDTSDKTIALEARLNRDISFDKGCYVGQETIERATARGGLKKKLYGLRFEGNRTPDLDTMLTLDGKEVGRLTSVTSSPKFGVIGLAVLHHSAWKPGTRVIDSPGEIAATVTDIPFR
jgi:folate-binding protein YgfZ